MAQIEQIKVCCKSDIVIIYTPPNLGGKLQDIHAIRQEIERLVAGAGAEEGINIPRFLVLPAEARFQIMNTDPVQDEPD